MKPEILDVTLRDGSYAIDFKFSAEDTRVICQELEKIGINMIEIGHGIGLGASKSGMGEAAESDEDYMRVAAEFLKTAQWGMFCIPGIAQIDDIDMAADYGMKFIRIGTNVTEIENSEKYIVRAKYHNMFVSANFMKSYAMDYKKFAEKAKITRNYGSDLLCIVDSAGGMLPNEIKNYFNSVKDTCDIKLGFHGHNNLELAVSNSILAIELGASVIDTSLQGIGRGGGNTPTEIFIVILERMGFKTVNDILKIMDIGYKYIKPLIRKIGYNSVDIISGFAQFHSSYIGIIRHYSSKYRLDPRRLIIEVCKEDKVNATEELVDRVASKMHKEDNDVFSTRFGLDSYFGDEQK